MRNVSSRDNLHNLTCEAENRAGMGEAVVQLDIECMWWNFLFFNFHHFSHLESCYFSRENQVVLLKYLPAYLKSENLNSFLHMSKKKEIKFKKGRCNCKNVRYKADIKMQLPFFQYSEFYSFLNLAVSLIEQHKWLLKPKVMKFIWPTNYTMFKL